MKFLTLIRHAKSSWEDNGLSDFERPLSARGEADAPRMGQTLLRDFLQPGLLPPPSQLVSSPARRALSTARIVACEIGLSPDSIRKEPRIYEASASTLLDLIREFPDSLDHVILFGHNPGLETLAEGLDPKFRGDGMKFPTCGVAIMRLRKESWAQVSQGDGRESTFFSPKHRHD